MIIVHYMYCEQIVAKKVACTRWSPRQIALVFFRLRKAERASLASIDSACKYQVLGYILYRLYINYTVIEAITVFFRIKSLYSYMHPGLLK